MTELPPPEEGGLELNQRPAPPKRNCSDRSNRILTASEIVFWEKTGEAPLEPLLTSIFMDDRRSYSQPSLPAGTGICGGEVSSPSLPRKNETGRKSTKVCLRALPLSYLPIDGEDRTRTDNHALSKRSNPDLTARKLNGAHRRSCTGLSGLQGRHVARYVWQAWLPCRVTLPDLALI